jgi:hypothetical protein
MGFPNSLEKSNYFSFTFPAFSEENYCLLLDYKFLHYPSCTSFALNISSIAWELSVTTWMAISFWHL